MADSKRLSLGGRIATPRVPPSMSMEQVLARCIGASIRIQTIPPTTRTITGHIFAASPSSPMITIGSASGSSSGSTSLPPPQTFTVLPISSIQSFTLLELGPYGGSSSGSGGVSGSASASASVSGASTPTSPLQASSTSPAAVKFPSSPPPPLPALDPAAGQKRLAETIAKLHAEEARRGKGVSREAQALFDALYRTLPVEWNGQNIVVSSNVVVGPPYGPSDCKIAGNAGKGGSQQALSRVRKVVENERKKFAAANGARPASAAAGGGDMKKGG